MMQYSGALTREQFMLQEMRITARLKLEGLIDQDIIVKVYEDNLFQYPTEREIKSKCRACLKRLDCIADMPYVLDVLANGTIGEGNILHIYQQICLVCVTGVVQLVHQIQGGKICF